MFVKNASGQWVATHPNLATHDSLGLATTAELDAHTTLSAHTSLGLATSTEVSDAITAHTVTYHGEGSETVYYRSFVLLGV